MFASEIGVEMSKGSSGVVNIGSHSFCTVEQSAVEVLKLSSKLIVENTRE